MIQSFKKISKNDLATAGGKGSNLGELFNLGYNVPNGFVVTTDAYYGFINKNNLSQAISTKIQTVDCEDIHKLDKVSNEIRNLILDADMPEDLKAEIKSRLNDFEANQFAVRSSATAEDLPTASFAGQQDTYLEIKKEDIIENVQKCWASLFTSRAIVYRKEKNIRGFLGMAVVVQEMVDADYAGVMFTLDPVFKKDILIECASGLGERVVSGSVTPNNYFLDMKTYEIKQSDEHESFPHNIIQQIARLGKKIENHYNHPQDVEFAVKDDEIFILQSRAITT